MVTEPKGLVNVQNALQKLEFPELFIGLVAPVGVDIQQTIDRLSKEFSSNGYAAFKIKVTDHFKKIKRDTGIEIDLNTKDSYNRIDSYIQFGNAVRKYFNDNSILSSYTIYRIMKIRDSDIKIKSEISFQKRVYIIHQFKRKEEIDLLRQVYGRLFYQISVYSKKESRITHLSRKLAHEGNTADQTESRPKALSLISRDENEKYNEHGQRVTKIFHDADLIINNDLIGRDSVQKQINRFIELLFSSNSISPTKQEYAMFVAKAAALRTLDLSRQVGAVIFRSSGEIISMGSNEVPKALGGTYWCDEPPFDSREYTRSQDSNDTRKREILREIYEASGIEVPFEEYVKLPKSPSRKG